jgi:hypothetical protein
MIAVGRIPALRALWQPAALKTTRAAAATCRKDNTL